MKNLIITLILALLAAPALAIHPDCPECRPSLDLCDSSGDLDNCKGIVFQTSDLAAVTESSSIERDWTNYIIPLVMFVLFVVGLAFTRQRIKFLKTTVLSIFIIVALMIMAMMMQGSLRLSPDETWVVAYYLFIGAAFVDILLLLAKSIVEYRRGDEKEFIIAYSEAFTTVIMILAAVALKWYFLS